MKYYIFFFLLAVMILAPLQGQCENWKEFSKDGDTKWQYDKDSIHYPEQKKNIFGDTVQNKNIVTVCIRNNILMDYHTVHLVKISCAERKLEPVKNNSNDQFVSHYMKGPIEPGSMGENLFKKVCP
jgi:hypothetical protein